MNLSKAQIENAENSQVWEGVWDHNVRHRATYLISLLDKNPLLLRRNLAEQVLAINKTAAAFAERRGVKPNEAGGVPVSPEDQVEAIQQHLEEPDEEPDPVSDSVLARLSAWRDSLFGGD